MQAVTVNGNKLAKPVIANCPVCKKHCRVHIANNIPLFITHDRNGGPCPGSQRPVKGDIIEAQCPTCDTTNPAGHSNGRWELWTHEDRDGQDCPDGGLPVLTAPEASLTTAAGALEIACTKEEQRKLEKQWLDGDDWDPARVAIECAAHLNTVMGSMEQLGRRLIAAKEILGHGSFTQWLADSELPISHQNANRYMAIARAVNQRPELRRIAGMGITKAAMVLALPEAQLEEIAQEGTLNGKRIEDIETMNRKELQKEIRGIKKSLTEAKAESSKKSELLESMRTERDEAHRKLGQLMEPRGPEPSGVELQAIDEMKHLNKLISSKCRLLEAMDVTSFGPEAATKTRAFVEWLFYRVERTRILVGDKFESMPDFMLIENEARTANFEGHFEADPMG